ncbi:flagellar hook-length control protein FliK [Noviherbaspirillum sp. Root189]|uniref:flagellar hook-length control protein FliK n=1 Tax=Noviherbaspirillum sp. Root189 TaxID=1736487 RepID=UPI00070F96C9|nr:flagellar hook-length control protein FliK [Noviherbaspirillum sp. Root189]KRB93315.1 hypothetical protein ASE07_13300 [Noviherbaspirillum sp. Root189]
MLPRADLNSPRPLADQGTPRPPASTAPVSSATSATDARQEVYRRLTQIAIGREVQATVDSVLDDGTYLVKLADTAARMALPVGTRVGDTLQMVFLAREPRPTFLLNQQGGSAPASLSTTGRLIAQLLESAQQQGSPTAVTARTPLLNAPGLDPQRLAAAMQEGLSNSGLFYESHLREWISGSRTLADLAREPQAQLAGADGETAESASQKTSLADSATRQTMLVRDSQLQIANSARTDADLMTSSQLPLPTLDPEAARIVHSQLNTLEQHQVRWQGELWPGQQMEWEVSEDTPEHTPAGVQNPVWNSEVRFELPHLGNVAASIRLVGDSVQVRVEVDSDSTAEFLRQHGGKLAERIEISGASLDALLVKRDEQT